MGPAGKICVRRRLPLHGPACEHAHAKVPCRSIHAAVHAAYVSAPPPSGNGSVCCSLVSVLLRATCDSVRALPSAQCICSCICSCVCSCTAVYPICAHSSVCLPRVIESALFVWGRSRVMFRYAVQLQYRRAVCSLPCMLDTVNRLSCVARIAAVSCEGALPPSSAVLFASCECPLPRERLPKFSRGAPHARSPAAPTKGVPVTLRGPEATRALWDGGGERAGPQGECAT